MEEEEDGAVVEDGGGVVVDGGGVVEDGGTVVVNGGETIINYLILLFSSQLRQKTKEPEHYPLY